MEMDKQEDFRNSARRTKGQRLRTLLDDEIEADEQFWTQEAFQEAENDNEYQEEKEVEDVFDSDFEEDEPESDDEKENEEDKRTRRKRRPMSRMASSVLKKAKVSKAKEEKDKTEAPGISAKVSRTEKAASAAAAGEESSEDEFKSSEEDEEDLENEDEDEDGRPRRRKKPTRMREMNGVDFLDSQERRKSSRSSVIVKSLERESLKALQTPRIVRRRKSLDDDRKLTQEEMLLEAAQTEILNRHSLEIMLAREEEVKKRAVIQKEIFAGPQIRFHSKGGKNTLEFTLVTSVPEAINAKAPPYPKRSVCVVTGLPAKYKDPVTGQPFATLDAFRTIRDRYQQARGWSRGHRA